MKQRADTAERTRERIVQATMELHEAQGVLATSFKDIARRADVGIGTVYHHFPTLDDLVDACGARQEEAHPVPPPESIDREAPLEERVASFVGAMVGLYAGMPWIDKIRLDARTLPVLARGLERWSQAVDALLRRALGDRGRSRRLRATITAITDAPVIHRLLGEGFSQDAVAETLTSLTLSYLKENQR